MTICITVLVRKYVTGRQYRIWALESQQSKKRKPASFTQMPLIHEIVTKKSHVDRSFRTYEYA